MATYWLHRGEHVEGACYRVFHSEKAALGLLDRHG
jgi:hypothetical protein